MVVNCSSVCMLFSTYGEWCNPAHGEWCNFLKVSKNLYPSFPPPCSLSVGEATGGRLSVIASACNILNWVCSDSQKRLKWVISFVIFWFSSYRWSTRFSIALSTHRLKRKSEGWKDTIYIKIQYMYTHVLRLLPCLSNTSENRDRNHKRCDYALFIAFG